ncbi:MAG: ABC transporter ATP-binding protein [Candidatus Absconditabacteria bacterium]|nr:ABC transporter ATP-binding protein [Candidatus Absconditabacteria bacterium]MDD3868729.1 ABC transporter ATP-binding protein [Candidatus Absconditabacteria bacterium]MDD4714772.1 ABC transporter ATP-binding protein [Candidatus Absconditabacteria bacterium]
MEDFIQLINIKKSYQLGEGVEPVHALRGINLTIKDGDFISIMGPSGCGKSTLMNIVGLLDIPTNGEYRLRGKKVAAMSQDDQSLIRRSTIGFVFQGYNLLKRMPAREQVALPLSYIGVSNKEKKERAIRTLEIVGLGGRESSLPNQLSGGQQQRVCIARALVSNPGLLLADEPTGALDSKTGEEILELFKKLNSEQGKTILLITHDSNIGAAAKTIHRMKDGLFID